MNETRLHELMTDAMHHAWNRSGDPDGDVDRMYIPRVFWERFGALIVKECALWAENNGGCSGEVDLDALNEHMGIK